MSILSDNEIAQLIQSQTSPLLENCLPPVDWFARDSLVKPSSLDLHIGNIYIPPKEEPKVGDQVDIRSKYTLHPGQAIVVDTAETLNLPNNIAAFGFPPTSISNRAILMTNPGHIDPGFKGKLNFTLINMGRDPFYVDKGRVIVTLLLIKLSQPTNKDFMQRNPSFAQNALTPTDLYLLGRDFLDLEERTRKAAENAVRKEDIHIKRMQVWVPIGAALLGGILAFVGAWLQSDKAIGDLKQEINQLKSQMNIETRLEDIESKIGKLSENTNKPNNANNSQTNENTVSRRR